MTAPPAVRINFILDRLADPMLYDFLCQFRKSARAEQLRGLAHDGALMRSNWLAGGSPAINASAFRPAQASTPTDAPSVRKEGGLADAAIDMFADPLEES